MTLDLKDPQYPEHNLGSLELAVTLSPKEGETKDAVRNLYKLSIHLSIFPCKVNILLILANDSSAILTFGKLHVID